MINRLEYKERNRMKIYKLGFLVLAFLFFAEGTFAQDANGLEKWLNLKVFRSTRRDVENTYGNTEKKTDEHFSVYEYSEGAVSVEYSYGNCASSKASIWNVPEWTVVEITYTPWKNPPKLTELIQKKTRFKITRAGDVKNHKKYVDKIRGIAIVYDDWLKQVLDIIIGPSTEDDEKTRCSNLK